MVSMRIGMEEAGEDSLISAMLSSMAPNRKRKPLRL
jgi:hypothetical protein